jgi:hypothetical protein
MKITERRQDHPYLALAKVMLADIKSMESPTWFYLKRLIFDFFNLSLAMVTQLASTQQSAKDAG